MIPVMTWKIRWDRAALYGFYRLSMSAAERLDRSLLRFAATNRGPVERVSPYDPRRLVLVVSGAGAYLFADPASGVLVVTRVFRRG